MSELWNFNSLESIGGNPTEYTGEPQLVSKDSECYTLFDGRNDALLVKANPIKNAAAFTIEVIFRPDYSSDPANIEQRFVHIQNLLNENSRILIELRLTSDGQWFLDTFIKSDENQLPLFADKFPHPCGEWYHAALTYENGTMRHFVNGIEEMSGNVNYVPIEEAHTSIGVRINHISWFKGGIKTLRFTDKALAPAEFLII